MKRMILSIILLTCSAFLLHLFLIANKLPLVAPGKDATTQLLMYRAMLGNEFKSLNFFWSWSYGLGGDLFAQFNYYYSNSIFFIVSLLFGSATMEQLVEANLPMSILKVSLASIFMLFLLRYEGRSYFASILAGLFYSSAMTFTLYMHIFDFMTDAFVVLPLLILAFHHYLKSSRSWAFIATFALVLVMNFYFAFILTLFFSIYAIYKYFERAEKSVKDFAQYVWNITLRYTAAVGLAAFSFLPAVYQFLSSDRIAKEYDIPLVFHQDFYEKVPKLLFMSYHSTYSVGMALFILLLLTAGFMIRQKELLPKKIFVAVMFLFFGIPFIYSAFNGFSAMQNRWYFLLAFSASYVAASFFDDVLKDKRLAKYAIAIYLLYTTYILSRFSMRTEVQQAFDSALLICAFVALVGLVLSMYNMKMRAISFVLIISSTVYAGYTQYSAYYTEAYRDVPDAQSIARFFDKAGYGNEEGLHVSNGIKRAQSEFGRVIFDSPKYEMNSGMYYGLKTHAAYQSLIPKNVHQLFKERYNIKQIGTSSLYHNYDNRLYLETAFGNEFYVSEMKTWYEPYGYETSFYTPNWHVRQNQYTLPIGYAFPQGAWMDIAMFNELTTPERDQAILHALVVEDIDLQQKPSTFKREQLQTQLLASGLDSIQFVNMKRIGEQIYETQKTGSYMEVFYERPSEPGEIYVEVDIETTIDKKFTMNISDKTMEQFEPSWTWAYPKQTFTFNIGSLYKHTPIQIHLTRNTYKISDVRVYFNSYEPYKELVAARQQETLQQVEYDGNYVKGTVTVEDDRLFFLSIPYSKGWTLKVNSEKRDIYEVQHAFIGFPIEKGTHTIELSYVTPFFKEGVAITVGTICILLFITWRNRKRQQSV